MDGHGGSDRGELGDGARHLEQDLFEGSRGLGDLDDPDPMIEGELGHRRRGRAVNRQSVVGDVELDVPRCRRPASSTAWGVRTTTVERPRASVLETVQRRGAFRRRRRPGRRRTSRARRSGDSTRRPCRPVPRSRSGSSATSEYRRGRGRWTVRPAAAPRALPAGRRRGRGVDACRARRSPHVDRRRCRGRPHEHLRRLDRRIPLSAAVARRWLRAVRPGCMQRASSTEPTMSAGRSSRV